MITKNGVEQILESMNERVRKLEYELEYELAEIYVDAVDADIFDEIDKLVIRHTNNEITGFYADELWINLKEDDYKGNTKEQVRENRKVA